MKDKKACIFYFLMTIIFLDFGNQIRKITYLDGIRHLDNPIFSIFHVNNTGGAFSLLQNNAHILALFGILITIFLIYQVYRYVSFDDKLQLLAITLFSAGTMGNVLERIQFGYVIDYIRLNFVVFPVFNSFDIMICLGIFLYCLYVFFDYKKEKNEKN